MATQEDEYYTNLLETMIEHNDRHDVQLSNKNLRQSVITIIAETEEE